MGGIHSSDKNASGDTASLYTTNEQKARNQAIEDKMMKDLEEEKKIMKILLLGAGECGKSTVLKQMKILHLRGFSLQEKKKYRFLIAKNILESIQKLCKMMRNMQIPYEHEQTESLADRIMSLKEENYAHILDHKNDIMTIWKDLGIQVVFARRSEYYLMDNAKYFLDRLDTCLQDTFVPDEQDILHSRITTTGIQETKFTMKGKSFKMYDVGGQRGERKKWIHAFDDVTAVMFVAALSEYDQKLLEDRTKNRMEESLDLFETVASMPWFKNSSLILFLNKNDMFEEKILESDLRDHFPEFNGEPGSYEAALKFIYDEYMGCVPDGKSVYVHVTDATNTENVQFVWEAAQHIILEKSLTSGEFAMF